MKNGRVVTTVFPPDMIAQLDALTVKMDRTKSWLVRDAMTDYLASRRDLLRPEMKNSNMDQSKSETVALAK